MNIKWTNWTLYLSRSSSAVMMMPSRLQLITSAVKPLSYYVRAVAAARQGDAEGVKTNLEQAGKDEKLAARAAKDVEFAQYR